MVGNAFTLKLIQVYTEQIRMIHQIHTKPCRTYIELTLNLHGAYTEPHTCVCTGLSFSPHQIYTEHALS